MCQTKQQCCIVVLAIVSYVTLFVILTAIIVTEQEAFTTWQAQVLAVMTDNAEDLMVQRARTLSNNVDVTFSGLRSDLAVVKNFTESLVDATVAPTLGAGQDGVFTLLNTQVASLSRNFSGLSQMPENIFNMNRTVQTGYFGGDSTVQRNAEQTDTMWFHPESQDPNNMTTAANLNLTMYFRNPWYATHDKFLAQGFGDTNRMARYHPATYQSNFFNMTYTCVSNDHRNGTQVTGYDPSCRPWFQTAQTLPDEILFSLPYVDALTGDTVITLSTAVLNRSVPVSNSASGGSPRFYGALFADVKMVDLENFLASVVQEQASVLDAFLIDEEYRIISYKTRVSTRETYATKFITEVLYPTASDNAKDAADLAEFTSVVRLGYSSGATSSGSKVITFDSSSDSKRHFVYSRVNGTNYFLGILAALDTENVGQLESIRQTSNNLVRIAIFFGLYFGIYFGFLFVGLLDDVIKGRHFTVHKVLKLVGFPNVFAFLCLMAVTLPVSLVANGKFLSSTATLLESEALICVAGAGNSNAEWLSKFFFTMQSNIPMLMGATSDNLALDTLSADLSMGTNHHDGGNASLLAQPLVDDPRLGGSTSSSGVSLTGTSFLVPNVDSTEYAAHVQLNVSANATRDRVDQTNRATYLFQSVYSTNEDAVLLYTGFQETGVFRKYPGGLTTDLSYDPRARGWYKATVTANYSVFTAPYKDFFSGQWMITITEPIFNVPTDATSAASGVPRSLVGVAGVDVLLSRLSTVVSMVRLFETGKVTIIHLQDDVVIADRVYLDPAWNGDLISWNNLTEPVLPSFVVDELKGSHQGRYEPTKIPMTAVSSTGVTTVEEYYVYGARLSSLGGAKTSSSLGDEDERALLLQSYSRLHEFAVIAIVPADEVEETVRPVFAAIEQQTIWISVALPIGVVVVVTLILVSTALTGEGILFPKTPVEAVDEDAVIGTLGDEEMEFKAVAATGETVEDDQPNENGGNILSENPMVPRGSLEEPEDG